MHSPLLNDMVNTQVTHDDTSKSSMKDLSQACDNAFFAVRHPMIGEGEYGLQGKRAIGIGFTAN